MRFYQMTALAVSMAASMAVALPASAGNWQPGAKEQFTKDCVTSASTRVDPKIAQQLCDCSATQAGKNLSTADLAKLNSPASNANEEVRARLLKETQSCRQKS